MATQVGARMVQVFEDRLWAYGGEFCISVPCSLDLSVAFYPDPAFKAFFREGREGITFTLEKDRLMARDKKGDFTKVWVIPRTDVSVLTVFGDPVPATLHRENLRFASSIVDPEAYQTFSRGVLFREGAIWAGRGSDLFCGASGLPADLPEFMLMKESCKVLSQQKSELKSIVVDDSSNYAVEFWFEDNTHIACRVMESEVPDMSTVFDFAILSKITLPPEVREDVLKTPCAKWGITPTSLLYHTDPNDSRIRHSEGVIQVKTGLDQKKCKHEVFISDAFLKRGLGLSNQPFEVTERGFYFYGEQGSYAVAGMHPTTVTADKPVKDKGPDRPKWDGIEEDDQTPF